MQCNCIHKMFFCKGEEEELNGSNFTVQRLVGSSDDSSSVCKGFNEHKQKNNMHHAGMDTGGKIHTENLSFKVSSARLPFIQSSQPLPK